MGIRVEVCTNNAKDPRDLVDGDWVEVAVEPRPQGIISFGRDAEACTIGIANSCGIEGIRYRHCALVFAGGSFRIDFDRGCLVFVSNSLLDFDASSPSASKLKPIRQLHNPFLNSDTFYMRLGQSFVSRESRSPLIRVSKRDADVKERKQFTKKQMALLRRGEMDTIDLVRRTDRTVRRQSWTLKGVVTGLVGCFVALSGLFLGVRTIEGVQAELRENVSTLQVQTPDETWIAETAPSVAQLVIRTNQQPEIAGSAWLWCHSNDVDDCNPNSDEPPIYLVTNAHVLTKLFNPDPDPNGFKLEAIGYSAIFPRRNAESDPVEIKLTKEELENFTVHPLDNTKTDRARAYDLAIYKLSRQQNDALGARHRFQIETTRTPREGDLSLAIGYPIEGSQNASHLEDPTPSTNWTRLNRRVTPFYGHISLLGLINDRACGEVQVASNHDPEKPERSLTMPAYYSLFSTSLGGVSGGPIIDRCSKKVFAIAQSQDSIELTAGIAAKLGVDDIPVGALLYAISIDGLLHREPNLNEWTNYELSLEDENRVKNPESWPGWKILIDEQKASTNRVMSRYKCPTGTQAKTRLLEENEILIDQELNTPNVVKGATPANGRSRNAWRVSVPGDSWYSIVIRSKDIRSDFVSIDVSRRKGTMGVDLIASWKQEAPVSGVGIARMPSKAVGEGGADLEIMIGAPLDRTIEAAVFSSRCVEPGQS